MSVKSGIAQHMSITFCDPENMCVVFGNILFLFEVITASGFGRDHDTVLFICMASTCSVCCRFCFRWVRGHLCANGVLEIVCHQPYSRKYVHFILATASWISDGYRRLAILEVAPLKHDPENTGIVVGILLPCAPAATNVAKNYCRINVYNKILCNDAESFFCNSRLLIQFWNILTRWRMSAMSINQCKSQQNNDFINDNK